MFLVYGGDIKRELMVSCYTDAGYLTDADDLKSQTGYVFVLNGGAVDWKSAKQSIFATSSVEADYIAAYDASKEAVWVRKFISRLDVVPTIENPFICIVINCYVYDLEMDEPQSDIIPIRRSTRTRRPTDRMCLYIDAEEHELADPFTKALAFTKHSELTRNIGMLPASSLIDKSTPSAISESKMWRKKEEAEGDGDDEDGIKGSFFA
ncbi:hypothetical protein Tco_0394319 [Tanacetum coccineum]